MSQFGSLDAERWARVTEIFHRLLEAQPAQRDRLLDQACAADPRLRQQVEELLRAHSAAGDFIETPATLDRTPAPDTGAEPSLVGRQIGPYRLVRVLGAGGMGVVYLAEDQRLGRTVALKALPRGAKDEPARRERLRCEARAAAALSHPGIAVVYALEEFGDQLFIAGEYVHGRTLREELAAGGIGAERALETALAIARALAAAHARGVVHRDLKPENVMRTPAGEIKILDFGLAGWLEPTAGAALAVPESWAGTPAYMAPEQLRGQTSDARVDLFALGIVIYELACGIHPFRGTEAQSTISRILDRAPVRLGQHLHDCPAALEAIVDRCLRKQAADRFASIHELIAALESVPRRTTSAGVSAPAIDLRPPAWWWRFHQLAASGAYLALLWPLWVVWQWTPSGLGPPLFFAALIAALATATLRLHLWFASRYYPQEWPAQWRRARGWLGAGDALYAATLLGAGATVMPGHRVTAAILTAAAVAMLVSSTLIEPATTRAAFGVGRPRPPAGGTPAPLQ
jgi:serine/threonine protein kinase